MTTLNLDQRRQERNKTPHRVELDGADWELPNPLPMVVAEAMANGQISTIIAVLFGDAVGQAAKAGIEDDDRAASAYAKAVNGVVARLGPIIDKELMETVLDDLYDMGSGKNRRREPQDHLPPSA